MLDADPNEPAEATQQVPTPDSSGDALEAATEGAAKKTAKKAPAKKAAAKKAPVKKAPAKTAAKTTGKRTTRKTAAPDGPDAALAESIAAAPTAAEDAVAEANAAGSGAGGVVDTPSEASGEAPTGAEDVVATPVKRTARKSTRKVPAKKAAAAEADLFTTPGSDPGTPPAESAPAAEGAEAPVKKAAARRAGKKAAVAPPTEPPAGDLPEDDDETSAAGSPPSATALLFQPPDPTKAVVTTRKRKPAKTVTAGPADAAGDGDSSEDRPEDAKPIKKATAARARKSTAAKPADAGDAAVVQDGETSTEDDRATDTDRPGDEESGERRRRRRGGRRRRRGGAGGDAESDDSDSPDEAAADGDAQGDRTGDGQAATAKGDEGDEGSGGSRRRRRRRRGEGGEGAEDAEPSTGRARRPRNAEDEITALSGSTRLEAKKQRRREGREAGRRRAPIVSEAEFLARREAVDRVMVIRQRKDLTQIAVLEDKVLVEHYVARESQTSLIGNVYLGRVQNVLPSMEAAFIDIGKGRNAVLYAGEVNWDALGAKNGAPRKIESVLKSGQSILVQVTKDPVGHKGARLTSQVSLPGRFLVYVPDGTTSGISRKLPDTERNRLKALLKEIVPDSAGVIVRTAAEGASEEELTRDVERLTARWADIESKVKGGNAPQLLYGEPDLTLKVVRDLFTEDFKKLVISGDDAWDLVDGYVKHVAPDLADRLEKYDGERDAFAAYRIDEQIDKALDRKVWLPSGGSLVIDRTEAMTVVDVNTGKFTGSGGNLEETVTKNNLEAAEEIVRQLRLRDIGGIIVVDFIDMVLESNRDLVLRRLVECLGRDRTRHQVAEVTSLGLVQMTRKRIGTGLLEAFSEPCEHCGGRGLVTHHEPVEPKRSQDEDGRRGRRSGRGRGRDETPASPVPSPKDVAAMARAEEKAADGRTEEPSPAAEDARDSAGATSDAPAAVSAEVAAEDTPDTPAETAAGASASPEEARDGSTAADTGAAASRSRSRSRGGRGRSKAAPAADLAETGPTADEAPDATAEPAEPAGEPAAEPAAEPSPASGTSEEQGVDDAAADASASVPVAPRIVTTVRRRGARRAAGPPSEITASAPATVAPATVAASGDVAPDDDGAGPRAGGADGLHPDGDGSAAASTEAEADAPATPHVPVKKRGSRRR